MAHRTVRCHRTCPVRQPRHQSHWVPTVGALTSGPALMSGGTPDMYCWVSGAPVWACLTSARAARAFNASQVAVGVEIAVAPLLHRTVRWIIARRLPRIPEGGEFEVWVLWCTGHVRWHTGQSGAPNQRCLRLSLCSLVEPNTLSFYWLSMNLWHLYNLYTRAN
jgi:hypothetical protein